MSDIRRFMRRTHGRPAAARPFDVRMIHESREGPMRIFTFRWTLDGKTITQSAEADDVDAAWAKLAYVLRWRRA